AFRFDVRRAGFDPAAAGVEGLSAALPDQLTMQADLDADGAIDAGSEEVTRWMCAVGPPRLSRIIGAQSLPVAAPVTRCGLRYFDGAGLELMPPAGVARRAEACAGEGVLALLRRRAGRRRCAGRAHGGRRAAGWPMTRPR